MLAMYRYIDYKEIVIGKIFQYTTFYSYLPRVWSPFKRTLSIELIFDFANVDVHQIFFLLL